MPPLLTFSRLFEFRRNGLCAVALLALAFVAQAQVAVTTQHNDNRRTGQTLHETVLNTSNVNVNTFGKLFSRTVDGQIYAQPLYVPALVINNVSHNVVYVATENNSVYAFDADSASGLGILWHRHLGTAVPNADISPACVDIHPQIGITATPVIDLASKTIYAVAKSKTTAGTYQFRLHALDLITGAEKLAGPALIRGRVPGTGEDAVKGYVYFKALYQNNRPGLLLMNGTVYVAFGATCDISPWHGWVFGYSASTLLQTAIYNTTANGASGGVWGGGQGLLGVGGYIYFMTGNGTFDVGSSTPTDFGDSVVKLNTSSGLTVADYFTPFNQDMLNRNDTDLGSGGPMALPGTNLIVGVGKDATLRLLNTNAMGEFHSGYNADAQEFQVTSPGPLMGAPIYWNSPNYGPVIYLWGPGDNLKAFQFTKGQFNTVPVMQSTNASVYGYSNSAPLSLSSNGNLAGTAIVWAAGAYSGDSNQTTVPGIVRAFDATNLNVELWNSKQNVARDDVGNFAKFCPPTIANGKVYVATFSNQLLVYGLNPP
jgi:putative pyrroloquinoline-quinone-binding quinoprotein